MIWRSGSQIRWMILSRANRVLRDDETQRLEHLAKCLVELSSPARSCEPPRRRSTRGSSVRASNRPSCGGPGFPDRWSLSRVHRSRRSDSPGERRQFQGMGPNDAAVPTPLSGRNPVADRSPGWLIEDLRGSRNISRNRPSRLTRCGVSACLLPPRWLRPDQPGRLRGRVRPRRVRLAPQGGAGVLEASRTVESSSFDDGGLWVARSRGREVRVVRPVRLVE